MVDENTIGVIAILGSTFTGHFEPVKVFAIGIAKYKEDRRTNQNKGPK